MVEDILMRIGSWFGLSKAHYTCRLGHGARILTTDEDLTAGVRRLTPTYEFLQASDPVSVNRVLRSQSMTDYLGALLVTTRPSRNASSR